MPTLAGMLDSDDNEKYHHHRKKSTTYRNQIQSLVCITLLPVAATVTTDVWYESAILLSSFGYELVLAITNVSGAFLDGFFSAFESGSIIPSDAKTEALHLIAYDMRAYSLSTYTSWSGKSALVLFYHMNSLSNMKYLRSDLFIWPLCIFI